MALRAAPPVPAAAARRRRRGSPRSFHARLAPRSEGVCRRARRRDRRRRARACAPRLGRRARLLDTRRLRPPGSRAAPRAHGDRAVLRLPPSAWAEFGPAVWTEEAVAALRARLHHLEAAGRTGDDPFAPYCVSCVNTALAAAIGADTPTTNAATRAYCGKWLAASASAAPSARSTAAPAVQLPLRPRAPAARGVRRQRRQRRAQRRRPRAHRRRHYCSVSRRAKRCADCSTPSSAAAPPPPSTSRLPRASTRRPRAVPPPPPRRRASTSARWAHPTQTASAAEHRMTEWFQHATALGRVVGHGQTLSERLHAGAGKPHHPKVRGAPARVARCCPTPSSPPKARRRRRSAEIAAAAAAAADFQARTTARSTRHLVQRRPPASGRHRVTRGG